MVASIPNHYRASPSPGPCAKDLLAASPSASSMAPPPSLFFCRRHGVFLLSLHNAVQEIMTANGSAVKIECTKLCNNFFHATKIRDEAQSRAHAGDPPEDHRGHHGAAPDRRPGAYDRERHR